MSNFNSKFLILILTATLLPIALSEPEAINALLKRLDSKRPSSSVQEAAAKAVLKRLLPGYVSSFKFKIVSNVLWIFFYCVEFWVWSALLFNHWFISTGCSGWEKMGKEWYLKCEWCFMLFLVPKDENLGEIVMLSCSLLLVF